MANQPKSALTRELAGILYLLVSILLACSFFSYSPTDLPLSRSPTTSNNWVGIVGAYMGMGVYSLIGWSANLLPLAAAYLGFCALFRPNFRLNHGAFWLLGFILCTACLAQVLEWGDAAWRHKNNNLFGIGGFIGFYVGKKIFWTFLKHGAVIVFLSGSGASLFMAAQVKPREVVTWIEQLWRGWKQRQRERNLQSGDIKTLLRTREEEIAERQRLIERELARRGRAIKAHPETKATEPPPAAGSAPVEPDGPARPPEPAPPAAAPTGPAPKPEKPEYKITRTTRARHSSRPAPQPAQIGPYLLPSLDLLKTSADPSLTRDSKEEISRLGALIETTLKDFGIEVQMGEITQGATVTRYEVIPSPGVKVERIVHLQNNLALSLKADRVNILAPVAGKGTVGIEVANITKAPVLIRELLESAEFQNSKAKIPLALGKDVYGKTLIADLAEMPHLLIAGSTGAGKSVCINSILTSILYKFSPEDMRLILIDPKVVELQTYNPLPHLVVPVVSDPKKIIIALRWLLREMEKRYKIMARVNVRTIAAFNARPKATRADQPGNGAAGGPGEDDANETEQQLLLPEEDLVIPDRLPYIVLVIDELADLMLTAPVDAEDAITRITQMARAAGIHLIVATQTPRAEVVTGTIKTNLPSKISFRVASKIDSRVILDENGAENLLGKGDMFYKSYDSSVLRRAQGAFISDQEVTEVVAHCAKQAAAMYDIEIQEKLSKPAAESQDPSEADEELIEQCIAVIRQEGRASTSLLQRRLRLGYTRAARVMDVLEERGIVGPGQGAKDREILIRLDGSPPGP